jgi:ABC-2 type transport system permease protein
VWALALRLQRGGLLWWGLGVVLLGVGYGSITGSIDDFVSGNQTIQDVIARGPGSLVDSFLATSLLILALVTGGFAVQAVGRLRTEESSGRAETLLATPTPRLRWAASHLAIAFGGSAVVLVAGSLGLGLLAGLTTSDLGQVPRVALASLAYVPPVWILAAIAAALFGVAPQWTALAWAPLAVLLGARDVRHAARPARRGPRSVALRVDTVGSRGRMGRGTRLGADGDRRRRGGRGTRVLPAPRPHHLIHVVSRRRRRGPDS